MDVNIAYVWVETNLQTEPHELHYWSSDAAIIHFFTVFAGYFCRDLYVCYIVLNINIVINSVSLSLLE